MDKPRRIILAIYCLLLAYCFIWIPWRVTFGIGGVQSSEIVYSLVWATPNVRYEPGLKAVPEMNLIFLRFFSLTAISGTAFELVGFLRRPATHR